jgi:hypothetical protein
LLVPSEVVEEEEHQLSLTFQEVLGAREAEVLVVEAQFLLLLQGELLTSACTPMSLLTARMLESSHLKGLRILVAEVVPVQLKGGPSPTQSTAKPTVLETVDLEPMVSSGLPIRWNPITQLASQFRVLMVAPD